MESLINFLAMFPSIGAVNALIILVALPLLVYLIYIVIASKYLRVLRNAAEFDISWKESIALFLKNYSYLIIIFNILLAILLCINQASLCYQSNLQFGNDITYYFRVNSDDFDNAAAISLAAQLNSFNGVVTSSRRQLTSPKGSWMAIIYHKPTWENLLTNNYLQNVCETENRILQNIECLNNDYYKSIIPKIFDPFNCKLLSNSSTAIKEELTSFSNSVYLQDNVDADNPQSNIIITYIRSLSCNTLSTKSMQNQFSRSSIGGIKVAYVEANLLNKEFLAAIWNTIYVSVTTLIVSAIILLLGLHGFVCMLITLLCMILSLIAATGILPYGGYGYFSAFNILSIYILVGVGTTNVLLFASAWREEVIAGQEPTTTQIVKIYSKIFTPAVFAACSTTISLFSKLSSPVVVISQVGLYIGTAFLIFFVLFHYIIIPTWIFTNYTTQGIPSILTLASYLVPNQFLPANFLRNRNFNNKNNRKLKSGRISIVVIKRNDEENIDLSEIQMDMEDSNDHTIEYKESEHTGNRTLVSPSKVININNDDNISEILTNYSNNDSTTITDITGNAALKIPTILSFAGRNTGNINNSNNNNNELIDNSESVVDSVSTVTAAGAVLPNNYTTQELSKSPKDKIATQKCYITLLGCFALMVTLLSIFLFYQFSYQSAVIDFGIPQIFPSTSNLGQLLYIEKKYKTSILSGGDQKSASSVASFTTSIPTTKPVTSPPTLGEYSSPTLFPVNVPTSLPINIVHTPTSYPSSSPSITTSPSITPTIITTVTPSRNLPHSMVPSPSPSISLTPTTTSTSTMPTSSSFFPESPTSSNSNKHHGYTDYTVSGCWGVKKSKKHIDSAVQVGWNAITFTKYVNSGKLYSDLKLLCDYVNSNKVYLNVLSTWNRTTDCVYDQLYSINTTLYSMNTIKRKAFAKLWWGSTSPPWTNTQQLRNILLVSWAKSSTPSGKLLGIDSVEYNNTAFRVPVWICANFSARSFVPSLSDDTALSLRLQTRWQQAFTKYGGVLAATENVDIIMGADAFTFPMLAKEVLWSIELTCGITASGFLLLLFLFTWNISITILGTVAIIAILLISLSVHLWYFTKAIDLLDIVVLIAVVGMIVDFPMHVLFHYFSVLSKNESDLSASEEDSSFLAPEALPITTSNIKKCIDCVTGSITDPILLSIYQTMLHSTWSLLGPLILITATAIPLLYATFELLRKTAQYIIILAFVSYLYAVLILPCLLVLTWRKTLCRSRLFAFCFSFCNRKREF